MVMIFHQTPCVDINYRIFPITTYEVVMTLFEEVRRIICWSCSIEYAKAMDKSEAISVVEKKDSFFNTSV